MSDRGEKPAPVFASVRPTLDFPSDEAKTLRFWEERKIFDKTLTAATRATGPSKGSFVFYEGPPTANGMPHNGHVLTRAVKDVFPRYKTMRGYDVPRKAGWDTHGLPVEVEVEKELKLHGKADIERYGVEPFVRRCIDSVFRYTDAWERLTEKIAFWVDLDSAYVTYHRSYVESVWWALSELFAKGLLYRGHRVCWWWPQGGTALSAAEVGSSYRTVDDPSVFVAFPLLEELPGVCGEGSTALCVWTTTPWTLPSNGYAAVRPSFEYVVVDLGDTTTAGVRRLVVAEPLREAFAKKIGRELPVVATLRGADLVGRRYRAPFDVYADLADRTGALAAGGRAHLYWRILGADFVTLDASGIVHVAPAFGEDDFEAHRREVARFAPGVDVPLLCTVNPDGTTTSNLGALGGLWVKDADPKITADLMARGLLVHEEKFRHDYPFCWRAEDDPLIQLARPGWYIRTTREIGRAIANNQAISWHPQHIQSGRFGDFLANNVDWALSRERYWGTPLNVWICSANEEHQHAPASVADIEKRNPQAFDHFRDAKAADPTLNEHLMVHKPWVDRVVFPCPTCGAEMRRVPEVIDCWFDSGAMPFAQWGFPHVPGSRERFDAAFPADFISEAIDQTRGWFYSLLMVATLVLDEATQRRMCASSRALPYPFKNCVVLGHVCDQSGKKESKSKGNYTPPEIILERVRMEFAATAEGAAVKPQPGRAFVAREDYEGLDLVGDSTRVALYRADREASKAVLELSPHKGLPRRVIVLAREDIDRLGLVPGPAPMAVAPHDVPRLPLEQRVYVEDPSTPAPGADAFRWFFYASSPPWTNTRHSLSNVRAQQKEMAIKLRNVYSFFVIYANIDAFSPAAGNPMAAGTDPASLAAGQGYRRATDRTLLDRWMLSELALASREVQAHLDGYRLYEAAQRLIDLVDALSNWYVRRSRARFWSAAADGGLGIGDKSDAYWTLYETLVTIAKLLAPFCPFFSEELYQNLVRSPWPASQPQSVHLCAYPEADVHAIDGALAREMRAVRDLVSVGLSVRTTNKLRVRQPLSRADIVLSDGALSGALASYRALICDELNVHEVRFLRPGEEGSAVRYVIKPNFRVLGPRLGKKVQLCKQTLARADARALHIALATTGEIGIDLDGERVLLRSDEVDVAVEANEGFAAAGASIGVVVLHTALTDALRDEGLLREIQSRVQGARKELNLGFTERIRLGIDGSDRVRRVASAGRAELCAEALACELLVGEPLPAGERRVQVVDAEHLVVVVSPLPAAR